MKNFIYTFLLFPITIGMFPTCLMAQTYHPFPDSSAIWRISECMDEHPFCDFHTALNDLEQATPSTINSTSNAAIKQTIENVANSSNAGKEKAGAEALLEFAGLGNFSETFVPLNTNLRTTSNDEESALVTPLLKDDLIKVYPNPNNGQFYVEYAIEAMQSGSFVLMDLLGKEIVRKSLQNNKGRLEVKEQIIPGIYLFKIIVNGETYSINKLVINHP